MDNKDERAEIEKIAERIVREDVYCNVDSLVRYSIEKSFEDADAPIGYDDLLDSGPDFDSMDENEVIDYLRDELGYNDADIADMDNPW